MRTPLYDELIRAAVITELILARGLDHDRVGHGLRFHDSINCRSRMG